MSSCYGGPIGNVGVRRKKKRVKNAGDMVQQDVVTCIKLFFEQYNEYECEIDIRPADSHVFCAPIDSRSQWGDRKEPGSAPMHYHVIGDSQGVELIRTSIKDRTKVHHRFVVEINMYNGGINVIQTVDKNGNVDTMMNDTISKESCEYMVIDASVRHKT